MTFPLPYQYNPDIAPLSKNNSFKFGYNNNWFNTRQSADDVWTIRYDAIQREPLPYRQECVATAQLIRDTTNLPIDLLYSGGRDSEVMLEAFLEAGIKFNTVIMRFADGLNAHELYFATKYCNSRGINPTIVDLDILKFMDGQVWDYAKDIYCSEIVMLPHMWLADQCDGYPVLGSGDVLLIKNQYVAPGEISDRERGLIGLPWDDATWSYDLQWYHREQERVAGCYRHFMKTNRPACPGFFQYTPEMMLSHLQEPELRAAISPESKCHSTIYPKYDIYRRLWNLEERTKFDGFELVRWQKNVWTIRGELESQFPGSRATCRVLLTDLINMLTGLA